MNQSELETEKASDFFFFFSHLSRKNQLVCCDNSKKGALTILCCDCSEKEEENDEVEDMEVENSMECKLSLNSYKIRFVKGSEDYLYRRQALKRAKEVSGSLYLKKICDWYLIMVFSGITKEVTGFNCFSSDLLVTLWWVG